MAQHPAGIAEPVGERVTVHPGRNYSCHLRSYIRRDGQEPAAMAVVEAKGPFLEILAQTQGHDILKFKSWRYNPAEPPEFEYSLDLSFDIAYFVGLFGEKIAHPLWQRGFYGIGIDHYGAAF